MPRFRKAVFKSQNFTPTALQASGIFTRLLHDGSGVSRVMIVSDCDSASAMIHESATEANSAFAVGV